ncbi:MAG TPA: DUF1549 and DUF1553 domain-containing protein [Chthonomonadaceae bacterium]|nr:DUF1549 and DUF1553 domain-containing protein [Chthonomonadaceae bacterium]
MLRRSSALLVLLILPLWCGKAGAQSSAKPAGAAAIDRTIQAAWKRENITPAPPVDDARFLRRIYLDIVGTIPPPGVVEDFLADKSPDKREKAVDALLSDPRYVDRWSEYWDTVLMGKTTFAPNVDRNEFRRWLRGAFAKNTPYNQFVTELITATGQNSTGPTYAEANGPAMMMRPAELDPSAPLADRSNINGAVNWQLKYFQTPADLAGVASKVFLGVQIQCAQCHDHKTEKWKQTDFRAFTACFMQAVPAPVDRGQMQNAGMNVRKVNLRDVNFPMPGNRMNPMAADRQPYLNVDPAVLDGTPVSGPRADRRRELAAWMTDKKNPWFAQAIVNRMWAKFLGRGFVEPFDDFRPSNPPVLPEALQQLADDFVAHHYDLKHLIKTICLTQVYQLSPAPSIGETDNKLWERFRLTPMGTDELLNSLVAATNFQAVLARMPGGSLEQIKARMTRQLSFVFNTDEEDMEQKEFEGTIPQALLMLNGNLTNAGVTPIPGTALSEVMAMPGDDAAKIEALYLRTVSRKPTATELQKWTDFVNAPREVTISPRPANQPPPGPMRPGQAGKPSQGQGARGGPGPDPLARLGARPMGQRPTARLQAYEDLFWALLNSSEFVFNH